MPCPKVATGHPCCGKYGGCPQGYSAFFPCTLPVTSAALVL
jgi:hypothetical protein